MANRRGKVKTMTDFIFLGSKITVDGDYSHEIKRHFLLGRKAMTNLDCVIKSRDITLPTKICIVKAMVFPAVMYRCESLTIKKAEHWRIDASELWCWRGLLGVPCMQEDQNNQSYTKSTLNIHWKDWYWSWSSKTLATWYKGPALWKRPWCWARLKAKGEGSGRGWEIS